MISRNELVNNLKSRGLEEAIADKNASANGTPAILIRWNGLEEYYTGFDIYQVGGAPYDEAKEQYGKWLTENFK